MSIKLSKTGKMIRKFKWVADDLAIANTSFYFYKKLFDAKKRGFRRELHKSPVFWGYTERAHLIVSLTYLCRVFDTFRDKKQKDRDAFHLLRLVEEIDESKLSDSEKRQRQTDLDFLQIKGTKLNKCQNPKVAKLRKWRNNLLSHSNEELIIKGLNDFLGLNPLTRLEFQQLIDAGFSIIERWAPYYKVSVPIKRLAQERADYLIVFQALQMRLRERT